MLLFRAFIGMQLLNDAWKEKTGKQCWHFCLENFHLNSFHIEVAKNVISIGIYSLPINLGIQKTTKSNDDLSQFKWDTSVVRSIFEGALAFLTITYAIPAGLWSQRHSECWITFPFAVEIISITILKLVSMEIIF